MKFPHHINLIFDIFHKNNFQIYLVGGCVRDLLLGKQNYDYDFTTDATPLEIKEILKDFKILTYGEKYGTIAVLIDGETIEITTFRKEIEYKGNRHPNVEFTKNLKEDLSRRDFTINTLCIDAKGNIIDYFDGQSDLNNRLIRAVGNEKLRFEEDALRILRALRFASQLNFDIEEKTFKAILQHLDLLDNISAERKFDEFTKTLMGKYIKQAFCKYNQVFGKICIEIPKMKDFLQNNPYHLYDILEHTAIVIDETPFDIETRIAAFFHDTGKVHSYSFKNGCGHFYGHGKISVGIANRDLSNLKISKKMLKNILKLIKYHDYTVYPESADVKRWLRILGEEQLNKLFDLQIADTLAKSKKALYKLDMITASRNIMSMIIQKNECYLLEDLAINGEDLKLIGIEGRDIGKLLEFVLANVIEDRLKNQKEELLKFIRQNYKIKNDVY